MRFGRYCAAGFLFDGLKFVFLAAATLRAKQLGASSTELALLLAVYTFVYVPACLLLGRRADRGSKATLARLGVVAGIASCVLAAGAGRLLVLDVAVALVAVASGLFWPSVQGALGAETDPARLEKALGTFNVSWSLGKSLGFAAAGWTFAHLGQAVTVLAAAAAALPVLLLVPGDATGRAAPPRAEAGEERRAVFRTLAYVANFACYGLGATLLSQFVKYLEAHRPALFEPGTFYGLFMGTVFGAQTLCFAALQRGKAWTYRRGPLYLSQLLAAGAAVALVVLRNDALALALAPLVGAGIGFAGASSIYYSLHGPADHAKYAGIHEAVLGVSTFLVPLAGGALADLTGNLGLPYWLAAGAVVAAIPVEEVLYRRRSRS